MESTENQSKCWFGFLSLRAEWRHSDRILHLKGLFSEPLDVYAALLEGCVAWAGRRKGLGLAWVEILKTENWDKLG